MRSILLLTFVASILVACSHGAHKGDRTIASDHTECHLEHSKRADDGRLALNCP